MQHGEAGASDLWADPKKPGLNYGNVGCGAGGMEVIEELAHEVSWLPCSQHLVLAAWIVYFVASAEKARVLMGIYWSSHPSGQNVGTAPDSQDRRREQLRGVHSGNVPVLQTGEEGSEGLLSLSTCFVCFPLVCSLGDMEVT